MGTTTRLRPRTCDDQAHPTGNRRALRCTLPHAAPARDLAPTSRRRAVRGSARSGRPLARAEGVADEAELHFEMGSDAYAKGDYKAALSHFFLSNRLSPNRNVVFNIARTFEQMGRYADAHRHYVDALDGETDPKAVADVTAAIARIAPRVAVLDVATSPPGATLYVDRKELGSRGHGPRKLALPPGHYRVLAELSGYEPAASAPIDAVLGGSTRVELRLVRVVGTVHVDVAGAPAAVVEVRADDERGALLCTAPCDASLPPGPHELYFGAKGFLGAPRQVNVEARRTVTVVAEMAPRTGSLVVSGDEVGRRRDPRGQDGRVHARGGAERAGGCAHGARRAARLQARGADGGGAGRRAGARGGVELAPVHEVTAVSRYAEQVEDAPSSVTVIDGQELRAFGYPTIAEALRGVRGVYTLNDGAYQSIGVRGIGQPNDYGNRVLVLSDGQPLNDNLLNSSYVGSDGRADLHDVERIEVMRGPGLAALRHRRVLRRHQPRHAPARRAEQRTHRLRDLRRRRGPRARRLPLQLRAGQGRLGQRLGSRLQRRRRIHPGPQPRRQHDAHHGARRRPLLLRRHRRPLLVGPVHRPVVLPHPRAAHPRRRLRHGGGRPAHAVHDTRYMLEARFEKQLGEYVDLLVRAHANRYTFLGDYVTDPAPAPPHEEHYYGTWFGVEARAAVKPRPWLRLTAGGEGQFDPQASLQGCCVKGADYLNLNQPYNFGAGYLVAEGTPVRWLHASVGARVDGYSTFGAILVPRAAIVFKPPTGTAIKIMGGRAFRAPSIYELYYTDGVSQVPGLEPARHAEPEPGVGVLGRGRGLPALQGGLGGARGRLRELGGGPDPHGGRRAGQRRRAPLREHARPCSASGARPRSARSGAAAGCSARRTATRAPASRSRRPAIRTRAWPPTPTTWRRSARSCPSCGSWSRRARGSRSRRPGASAP